MKKVLLLSIVLVLVGCDRPTSQWVTTAAAEIPGMPGCTYQLVDTGPSVFRVVRCSNQTVSTTYKEGKVTETIVTVDTSDSCSK